MLPLLRPTCGLLVFVGGGGGGGGGGSSTSFDHPTITSNDATFDRLNVIVDDASIRDTVISRASEKSTIWTPNFSTNECIYNDSTARRKSEQTDGRAFLKHFRSAATGPRSFLSGNASVIVRLFADTCLT